MGSIGTNFGKLQYLLCTEIGAESDSVAFRTPSVFAKCLHNLCVGEELKYTRFFVQSVRPCKNLAFGTPPIEQMFLTGSPQAKLSGKLRQESTKQADFGAVFQQGCHPPDVSTNSNQFNSTSRALEALVRLEP